MNLKDLLDFESPDVGYEDMKGKSICGCCRTYFVVSEREVKEIKEIVSDMYEACQEAIEEMFTCELQVDEKSASRIECTRHMLEQAIAKADGEEGK